MMDHAPTRPTSAHGPTPASPVSQSPARTGPEREVTDGVEGPLILARDHEDDPRRVDRDAFLRRLRHMATTTASDALGPRWTAEGCPYIDAWFVRHAGTPAETLEAMARRYGGLRGATSVDELIAAIQARIRLGIAYWQSGEDLSRELELAGLHETATAAGDSVRGAMNGDQQQAQRVVAELGEGTAIPQMPDVRVHTDTTAAQMADRAEAHAFTIGRDIVYAATAPRPGSLAGDLLLAHELAHVEQQRQPAASSASTRDVEHAAHGAAIESVARTRGIDTSWLGITRRALTTPLSLRRCPKNDTDADQHASEPAKTPEELEIEGYKERLDISQKTIDAKASFGDVGAALAEQTATEHWLAVKQSGAGPATGSESGETGLPKCNCTTNVVDILEATFTAFGRDADWKKVKKKALKLNKKGETGMNGIPIQRALQSELGWKGIFFAPDPTYKSYKKKKRDSAGDVMTDSAGDPIWIEDDEHGYSWRQVKKKKKYYDVKVDHSVVDYAPEAGGSGDAPDVSTTTKDTSQLDKLKKIPFAVLTARGAKHMALLVRGVVFEVHWDETASSMNLYQQTPLEDWWWDSGVIVAPSEDVDKAFGAP